MTDHSVRCERSPTAAAAAHTLLDELRDWAHAAMRQRRDEPPSDVHDQLTYTVGWGPLVRCDDTDVLAFLKTRRDLVAEHFTTSAQWRHGYWRKQEVHHGTEHYELFLGTLLELDPQDGDSIAMLLDATEHIGNWSDAAPPWYDEAANMFRSSWLGTDHVDPAPEQRINLPDHFRCANLCLLAWRFGSDERYLELARRYVARWADAICTSERIPAALTPDGELDDATRAAYLRWAGQAGTSTDDDLNRSENLLASDAVSTLLCLHGVSDERRFLLAAERLLDALEPALGDPDASAVADAVRRYRAATGNDRYDAAVRETLNRLDPDAIRELGVHVGEKHRQRPDGVGKRGDMPDWLEDGRPRRHNPALLMLAAELDDDDALAARALDLGSAQLRVARQVFPDGHEHGCSARSVSAVARGHGRDNNAGICTAVLAPWLARHPDTTARQSGPD